MNKTIVAIALFFGYCLPSIFSQIIYTPPINTNLPPTGQDVRDGVNATLNQVEFYDKFNFEIGEIYFHQLFGNQVVGLYETEDLCLIFEGGFTRNAENHLDFDLDYHPVPKTAF